MAETDEMALAALQQEFAAPGAGLAAYDTDQVARVAAKAYVRIAAAWKLSNPVAAGLIAVSPRTWARMKAATGPGA